MPLSDADIFKAQFYKFYLKQGTTQKNKFVERWKDLSELCNKIFHPRKDTPVDDLFRRYMYYLLAKNEVKNDTFPDMRDYYEKNGYRVLQSEQTFDELETLANFWNDVTMRNEKFSPRVLRSLYILSWTPYSLWAYVVSIYFMGNRDSKDKLNNGRFFEFLDKITAMFLMYAVTNPGVQSIRRPFVLEFKDIFHGEPLNFDEQFKPQEKIFRNRLAEMRFSNSKSITRAILAWWTFRNPAQDLPPLGIDLQIEHILAKKQQELHHVLTNSDVLELLGNKSLLEKTINIRAADYRLVDKKIFYLGDGKTKQGTFNLELRDLAEKHDDFTEADILRRNEEIFDAFISYLRGNDLLI